MEKEFELNRILSYLAEHDDDFINNYMSVLYEEGTNTTNEVEFNKLKMSLYELIREVYLTNEMYLKSIKKEIKMAKFSDFLFNENKYKKIYTRIVPGYIDELMQVKKLIGMMFEYINKIEIDDNSFGLTDLFILSSAIIKLSRLRFADIQRQFNIYDSLDEEYIDSYKYGKLYSNEHIEDGIKYLTKTLGKSI